VRVADYRGFVFASLGTNVPPLLEHLGEARLMLDLIADQAPNGLEFVPGSAHYTFAGNWKMQFENGLDAYHFPSTHAAFVNIIKRREVADCATATPTDEHTPAAGTISFPRGHAMSWSIGAPGQDAQSRPLTRDKINLAAVRERVGEARLNWMLRQRNLTIFPNLQVIDIQSMQLRTWLPLAVDATRMASHCLAPKGESAEARRYRIRQYEEFFNAGGLATADDNVMYELGQAGFNSSSMPPAHAYARGMGAPTGATGEFAALGLEHAACTYSTAGLVFGDETGIHSGYREWRRLLLQGGGNA
jgi:benzoate/toluate 1,2-dioxygenase alpha subunit/2,4,5-trichlorophenoxyacetic acid oxygenase 1